MQIVVVADDSAAKEFTGKGINQDVQVHFAISITDVSSMPDVLFYLLDEEDLFADIETLQTFTCPVFVHSVPHTLEELPGSFIRINAWPGFLKRDIVEVVANKNSETVKNVFEQLGWKYQLVPDILGMIAASIVAMIINEAYFALGDNVSTKEDIDTAMRLGTNYPFGPFEWSVKIGLHNILNLLNHLAISDNRYTPAPLLINETRI